MNITYSILPVLFYIAVLIYLDSFKLINKKRLVYVFLAGIISALISYLINNIILDITGMTNAEISIYAAPFVEEIIKFSVLLFIIHKGYSGFIIDTAIYGFIIGSGFAFAENIYYYINIGEGSIMENIIRGFGTSLMHGSTVSLAGGMFIFLRDVKNFKFIPNVLISILPALIIHILYNLFLLPPVFQTAAVIISYSISISLIFTASENSIHKWINSELDTEMELINLLEKGQLKSTHAGKYIDEIKERFSNFVVFDMICLIRVHTELSMQLKINMMLRINNLEVPEDPELQAKLTEYRQLINSIGKTAYSAIKPIMLTSSKDIWKMNQYRND